MKRIKRQILILLTILLSFAMVSCHKEDINVDPTPAPSESLPTTKETVTPIESTVIESTVAPDPTRTFVVNFYVTLDELIKVVTTNKSIIAPPEIPDKKNFKVVGWADMHGRLIDLSIPLDNTITLFPKYEPDYVAITNQLTHNIISSNVKIVSRFYDFDKENNETNVWFSAGSGVIFHEENGLYYVLTNEHVIDKRHLTNADYTISDYKGNEYSATIKEGSVKESFDLAVLIFAKDKEDLHVIKRARKNPIREDEIIAIGQPQGQINAIVYGKVITYTRVSFNDGSQLKFDVIYHNALIKSGSSGGALLDMNFNLVGINYANGDKSTLDYATSYAIPIEMIELYLERYVFV